MTITFDHVIVMASAAGAEHELSLLESGKWCHVSIVIER